MFVYPIIFIRSSRVGANLATKAFETIAKVAFKVAGFTAGILVSLFTSSNLTREVFIRGQLEDGTPVTYLPSAIMTDSLFSILYGSNSVYVSAVLITELLRECSCKVRYLMIVGIL